ncbi:MAG: hypothetical protein C4560_14430 [Nitrospiraceae bacterium]|nr:MAG: hypothetical protein C4560_14430 [Nitrospiraceae bacterium]
MSFLQVSINFPLFLRGCKAKITWHILCFIKDYIYSKAHAFAIKILTMKITKTIIRNAKSKDFTPVFMQHPDAARIMTWKEVTGKRKAYGFNNTRGVNFREV